MADGIRTDHDPPKPRHLNEDGQDTRPLAKIRPRPGDHPKRKWRPEHLDAGYHLQDWQPVTPDHDCLGEYVTVDDARFVVAYLAEGHTHAPEYLIQFEDGHAATVLDHTVVAAYVEQLGAGKVA